MCRGSWVEDVGRGWKSWSVGVSKSVATSFPGPFPYLHECGAGKDPGIGWSRATLHPEILGVIGYRGLHNQKYQNQDDGETVCAKSTWTWF